MTQQEFMVRTGYTPSTEDEFWAIHDEYVNSPFNKDEFCKVWKRKHAPEYRKPCVMNFATEAETEQKVIELTMKNRVFRVTGRKQICVY